MGSAEVAEPVDAQRLGLNTYGDMELRLGERIVEAAGKTASSG